MNTVALLHSSSLPMKTIRNILLICSGIACVLPFAASLCVSARADVITVTISGTGSGTYGVTPFTNEAFHWNLTYDTNTAFYFEAWGPTWPTFVVSSSVITLEGEIPATINFTVAQGIWIEDTSSLSMAPIILNSGSDPAANYDILDITGDPAWNGFTGPYPSTPSTGVSGNFAQFIAIDTDQGPLTMDSSSTVTSVTATPEPSSIALLAASGAGLALLVRSRKRRG